jgi:hypothetical protein
MTSSVDICDMCGAPLPCKCVRELGFRPKARKRWKSSRYLAWVRTLPCSVPHCEYKDIEAAHFGPRAIGTKVHDCLAIPLCSEHHRGHHAAGRAWVYYDQVIEWQIKTMAAAIVSGVKF